jgi:hypothetical protein
MTQGSESVTFQARVQPWLMACFGEMIAGDREERNHRFLEEALELVQACGCTASEAHQLVDYVYGRPVGELHQEVGGVMVTLAALCLANDADMHAAGWVELHRIWDKVEAIRAKQAAKPKHSPLAAAPSTSVREEAITAAIAKADEDFRYSFNLTRLVDGEETHTLFMDGFEPVEFDDRDDGYRLIAERRNKARATAVLAALVPSPDEGKRHG